MFDDVTTGRGDGHAARRFGFVLLAAAVQTVALAGAAHLLARPGGSGAAEGAVPVIIVRSPPLAPLRPPAMALDRGSRPATAVPTARVEPPRRHPKVSRASPSSAPEPTHDIAPQLPRDERAGGVADIGPADADEGETRPPSDGAGVGDRGITPGPVAMGEDAPTYPGAGFRRPQQAERDCVQNSVRIPSGLRGFASGPVTAKFAVGADGAPTAFELVGDVPDARIAAAIWQAIMGCRWIAGSDAQGRPAKLWVIMPIRFQAGS